MVWTTGNPSGRCKVQATLASVGSEHAKSWYQAAQRRHSRRTFDAKPVDDSLLEQLAAICERFRPFSDARVELVRSPQVDIFRGAIGSYGKVCDAPHLLVVIAGSGPFAQQHTGYTGEACILEATRLGLDTCWVGGFFDHRKVERIVTPSGDERVVAVSPVGHATESRSTSERAMEGIAGSHKRKPLGSLVDGEPSEWPAWARAAVTSARIAPSATNRQPWRFAYRDGSLVLSMNRSPELPRVTKRLDCGIAMLHLELGALSEGVAGTWHELSDGRSVARFEPTPEETS